MASSMPRKPAMRASSCLVLFLRAADEPHRGHAVAIAVERLLRGLRQLGIVGEPEIVVGAKIDDAGAIGEPHGSGLLGGDDALALV